MSTEPPPFDPRALGAQCDLCPLKDHGPPVPCERHARDEVAYVGERPGPSEKAEGRPCVGDSGQEAQLAWKQAGLQRAETFITHAVLCAPPSGDDLPKILTALRKENKRRNADNAKRLLSGEPPEPLLLTPEEACKPRLLAELRPFDKLILAGNGPLHTVLGGNAPILAMRGGMIDCWAIDPSGDMPGYTARAAGEWADKPPASPARRLKILPTVSPAFIMHARRWTKVFRSDVARALRWFRGSLTWEEPQIQIKPTPAELARFLVANPALVVDVETEIGDPLLVDLLCIGVGNATHALVVPLRSKFSATRFYSPEDEALIKRIFAAWMADRKYTKIGHNLIGFDLQVCERHFGVRMAPILDTLLLHRSVESELPHNLGFVVSLYSEINPAWKADHTATEASTDHELHDYNGKDNVLNMRVVQPLLAHVHARAQQRVVENDHLIQHVCADMHEIGMKVDQKRRSYWENALTHGYEDPETKKWHGGSLHYRGQLTAVIGRDDFNPMSVPQVRDLLFEQWRLPIAEAVVVDKRGVEKTKALVTKGGDPSTSDEAIRALLNRPEVRAHPHAQAFLLALRGYRAKMKLLGTYVNKLKPQDQNVGEGLDLDDVGDSPLSDPDVDPADQPDIDPYELIERARAERKRQRELKRGAVGLDGRIRPFYTVGRTTSGRLASNTPNWQNVPGFLRDMIVPEDGNVYVSADADQIELRFAAAWWMIPRYLDALNAGADPHAATAYMVFGETFPTLAGFPKGGYWKDGLFFNPQGNKWSGEAKIRRDLAKRVQYAGQYKASVETVWRVITSSEDDDGNLIYLNLSRAEVRRMYDAWIAGVPEFKAGWERDIGTFRRDGFLVEPIMGRRRDFLDGENPNEIVNFSVQAGGAAIIHKATLELIREVPHRYRGRCTGLVTQTHDALTLEVPREDAERVAKILGRCMTRVESALPDVTFTGAANIGENWGAV